MSKRRPGSVVQRVSLCVPEALSIPFETLMACDSKLGSVLRIKASEHRENIGHFFHTLEDAIHREGPCHFHSKGTKGAICTLVRTGADCAVIGMSCKPFTVSRTNHILVPPHEHPDYDLVMEDVFRYLDANRPKGGIAEEVLCFDQAMPDSQKRRERTTAPTYMTCWLERLANRGYAYSVVNNNNIFIKSPKNRHTRASLPDISAIIAFTINRGTHLRLRFFRLHVVHVFPIACIYASHTLAIRYFVIFCNTQLGGLDAVKWIVWKITETLEALRANPDLPLDPFRLTSDRPPKEELPPWVQ